MNEVDDAELVAERIAALDLGNANLEGMCAGCTHPPAQKAYAGAARIRHHHSGAAEDGDLVAALGCWAGGDGRGQHRVAEPLAPRPGAGVGRRRNPPPTTYSADGFSWRSVSSCRGIRRALDAAA